MNKKYASKWIIEENGRMIYVDPITRTGYLIPRKDQQQFLILENRVLFEVAIAVLAFALTGILLLLPIILVILYPIGEILYRVIYLKRFDTIEYESTIYVLSDEVNKAFSKPVILLMNIVQLLLMVFFVYLSSKTEVLIVKYACVLIAAIFLYIFVLYVPALFKKGGE